LEALRQANHRGFNATAPLKVALLDLVDRVDPSAARVGAINTVCFEAGLAVGANTDLSAYRARIAADGWTAGPTIVLGAGGAARAALVALHEAGAAPIWLLARRPDAARAMANALNISCEIKPLHQFESLLADASLVIGCLPEAALPALRGLDWRRCRPDLRLIESGYTAGARAWVAEVSAAGRRAEDGLPLLVAQGVAAFVRFTGRQVAEAPVLAAVRARLAARPGSVPDSTAPGAPSGD
jgi:shikimate dehydrogenase